MRFARAGVSRFLSIAAASAVLLASGGARADIYGDVNQLVSSGRAAEAVAKADQHLAAKPKDPQMLFIKGVALSEAGRTADAIALFQRLTEEYPELPEPYNNLAVLHAARGEYEKARAALETAIRANPNYATAHENLGDIYARLAIESYGRALQLDAANSTARPKLALIRELFSGGGTRTSSSAR